MKAARWHGRGDVRVEDLPEPSAGPGEVKVKVRCSGICGSDLHEYASGPVNIPIAPHPLSGRMAPLILGHEFSGEIAALGSDVTDYETGERVTAPVTTACGQCAACARGLPGYCKRRVGLGVHVDGAMAQYVVVPAAFVHKLPPSLSYEEGAMVEPLAIATRFVRSGQVQIGDTVAVVGAGPIGLAVVQAARVAGATKVVAFELSARRKEVALELGADALIDPREPDALTRLKLMTDGGAHVSFECAGSSSSTPLAVEATRRGGRVMLVAVFSETSHLDLNRVTRQNRDLVSSWRGGDEFETVITLLSQGRLRASPMITALIKLEEIVPAGFKALVRHSDEHVKILVNPQA